MIVRLEMCLTISTCKLEQTRITATNVAEIRLPWAESSWRGQNYR